MGQMDPIQRHGVWWTRTEGGWLRFDPATERWEPSLTAPPPPPPPPPGYVAPAVSASFALDGSLGDAGSPDGTTLDGGADLDGGTTSAADTFPYDPTIYVPLPKKSGAARLRGVVAAFDPRVAIAGGLVLIMLLLGGVGWTILGGDQEPVAAVALTDAGTKKLTPKQRFIHKADALCADVMTATRKLSTTPTTLREATVVMSKARAIIERAIRRGHAIKAPPKARTGWKRFVGTRAQLRVFDDMMSALVRGDVATVQRLEAEVQKKAARERRWAKRYGMKVCSQKF